MGLLTPGVIAFGGAEQVAVGGPVAQGMQRVGTNEMGEAVVAALGHR